MPKVKVPWLCSRSQPGIKVIIRDIRGHLLHTVTFLVILVSLLIRDELIKERICSYMSIFLFYEIPFQMGFVFQVSKQEVTKIVILFCHYTLAGAYTGLYMSVWLSVLPLHNSEAYFSKRYLHCPIDRNFIFGIEVENAKLYGDTGNCSLHLFLFLSKLFCQKYLHNIEKMYCLGC